MSEDSFQVDLNELDNITARAAGFIGFLADSLTALEQRVATLQQSWTGDAADAQADAFQQWAAGAADVRDGIEVMRQAALAAHERYSSAVDANRRMLGR